MYMYAYDLVLLSHAEDGLQRDMVWYGMVIAYLT